MSEITRPQPTGTPTWIDLGVPDVQRAQEFYHDLFGWEYDEGTPLTGGYVNCLLRGHPIAGLAPNMDPAATAYRWTTYFATDDCDAIARRVTEAGGTLVMPPTDVMHLGRMAVALDSGGAQFGLWQSGSHIGARLVNEPGTMAWNELITPDAKTAGEFYATVFGHGLEPHEDVADFDYTVLTVNGHEVGGIYGTPAETPFWLTYFAVEDADLAARRATAAGGTVQGEPWDSPYGRVAAVQDPLGVAFRVIQPAENPPE